jgi:hypothetical protein
LQFLTRVDLLQTVDFTILLLLHFKVRLLGLHQVLCQFPCQFKEGDCRRKGDHGLPCRQNFLLESVLSNTSNSIWEYEMGLCWGVRDEAEAESEALTLHIRNRTLPAGDNMGHDPGNG